jgi:hypothetical protein
MSPTSEATLEFALGHLRWSLDRPLVYGDREWANRVNRALDRVADAFDQHVESVEGPDGWFAHFTDPHLLPLTQEAQQMARLREEHVLLRDKIRCLVAQFRNSLLLFPPHLEASLRGTAAGDPQEAQAFRLFRALDLCVAGLLAMLGEHLAAEESLLQGTVSRGLPRESPATASHPSP